MQSGRKIRKRLDKLWVKECCNQVGNESTSRFGDRDVSVESTFFFFFFFLLLLLLLLFNYREIAGTPVVEILYTVDTKI